MNRDLVPTEEYFRPQRAAELRRKADRVEWGGLQVIGILTATFVMGSPLALFAAWVALLVAENFHRPDPILTLVLGTLGTLELVAIAVGLICWVCALQRRIQGYRQEARTLEAEHQTRYGARTAAPLPELAPVE